MTIARATAAPKRRSSLSILVEFLGSMNLAITLLAAVAIASVIGTVLQQNQPYTDYIIKFGPFWHKFFLTLGLYDVYSANWFLVLLGFLLVSTTVCVYRNAPVMLRDMRRFRLNVQEKSLRTFHHKREAVTALDTGEVLRLATALFQGRRFRVRVKDHEGYQLLSAMRGGVNRLGYLLTHVAIVVICVGGLLNGNLPVKFKEMEGRIKIETRNVPASQVPPESRLGPDNFSFRGSVSIAEGTQANVVFLSLRDGYLVQELPFAVEVKDFRIEHYATGQPKSFQSDIVIHDDVLDKPLETTIEVNHPLIYRGFAIYQASFRDGGSRLGLKFWPLDTQRLQAREFTAEVFNDYAVQTPKGKFTLEMNDFSLFNVNPVPGEDGKVEQRNMGPSFTYRMRNEAGAALEYQNYMNPVEFEGRYYFLSGMRESPADPFSYLRIPMDGEGGVGTFMTLLRYLQDPVIVAEVAEAASRAGMREGGEDDALLRARLADTLAHLLGLFGQGGMQAVFDDVHAKLPEEQRAAASETLIRVLQTGLRQLYLRVLADKGLGTDAADPVFFEDALAALSVLPFYGTPYYIQLSEFEHIQASGLQIAKQPGKHLFLLGSIMLTAGVFLLFYVAHQRLWVWVRPLDGGGSEFILAGTSNRNVMEFEKQFDAMGEALLKGLEAGADEPDPTTTSD